jgi:hypothetical protein
MPFPDHPDTSFEFVEVKAEKQGKHVIALGCVID